MQLADENVVAFDRRFCVADRVDFWIDVLEEQGGNLVVASCTDGKVRLVLEHMESEPTALLVKAYSQLKRRFEHSMTLREAMIEYFASIGAYVKDVEVVA